MRVAEKPKERITLEIYDYRDPIILAVGEDITNNEEAKAILAERIKTIEEVVMIDISLTYDAGNEPIITLKKTGLTRDTIILIGFMLEQKGIYINNEDFLRTLTFEEEMDEFNKPTDHTVSINRGLTVAGFVAALNGLPIETFVDSELERKKRN